MKFHLALFFAFVAAAPMKVDTIPIAVATEVEMVPQAQSCRTVYGPDGRVLSTFSAAEARYLPKCECNTPDRRRNMTSRPLAARTTTTRQLPLPTSVEVNRNVTPSQGTVAAPQNQRMQRETRYYNRVGGEDCCTRCLETCTELAEVGECVANCCVCVVVSCSPCIITGVCLGLN